MTLYFFERITDDDFIGPVIVAAASEDEAWDLLAARERSPRPALEALEDADGTLDGREQALSRQGRAEL